jgi:uncharacterized protein
MHNKTKSLAITLTILVSSASATTAWSAGFDCKKAKTAVEKMICADEDLSKLDSKLKAVFDEAQSEHIGVDGETGRRIDPVGSDQKNWLNFVRNSCKNSECLKYVYEARISDIQTNWLSK